MYGMTPQLSVMKQTFSSARAGVNDEKYHCQDRETKLESANIIFHLTLIQGRS